MHKIGVISDTHGLLRPEVVKILQGCEVILHGGDFDTEEILDALEKIAPVHAVRGNNDYWDSRLPETLSVELYGVKFFMVHDKKEIPKDLTAYDIIVYGHSHKYEEKTEGNIIYLNPGSCGVRRFRLPVTMMVLTLFPEERRIEIEKIDCLSESEEKEQLSVFPQKEMDRLIRKILKEMNAGKGVAEIAGKVRVDRELVEQICRIYTTHPGVDVDGILNRMDLKDL